MLAKLLQAGKGSTLVYNKPVLWENPGVSSRERIEGAAWAARVAKDVRAKVCLVWSSGRGSGSHSSSIGALQQLIIPSPGCQPGKRSAANAESTRAARA